MCVKNKGDNLCPPMKIHFVVTEGFGYILIFYLLLASLLTVLSLVLFSFIEYT